MKKILLSALAAIAVLAAGCSRESGFSPGENGISDPAEESSVKVVVKSEGSAYARAIGDPTTDEENTVKSFSVYVFNNTTGVLEKTETFTEALQGEVSGLSLASQKKVVVLVNRPAGFPAVANYEELSSPAAMVALSTQVPGDFSSTGLFMSGEHNGPVTLSKENAVSITVKVKRVTAKVRLGSLTVSPESGLSIDDFEMDGISIQQARDKSPALGGLAPSGFSYIGGLAADGGIANQFLYESYSLGAGYTSGTRLEPKLYFYVFANDNTDGNATLMTLAGKYKGDEVFFPFYINDKVGTGENASDGTWIQANKIYTLNITLRKVGSGGEDPNIPNEQVSVDVGVEIADWEGELIQDVEW